MDWILAAKVLRRLFAVAVFAGLIYTFSAEAQKKGRSRLNWVLIGFASFYGTYFLFAAGIIFVRVMLAGGFDNLKQMDYPAIVASSILFGMVAAFGAAYLVFRKLRSMPGPEVQAPSPSGNDGQARNPRDP